MIRKKLSWVIVNFATKDDSNRYLEFCSKTEDLAKIECEAVKLVKNQYSQFIIKDISVSTDVYEMSEETFILHSKIVKKEVAENE